MIKKDLVIHIGENGTEIIGEPRGYRPVLIDWWEIHYYLSNSKRCKVAVEEKDGIMIELKIEYDTNSYHYDPQLNWLFTEEVRAEEFLDALDRQFVDYWGMKKEIDGWYYWKD